MKNFKLYRTGSLVLGLWLLFASVYVVLLKFEIPRCCIFGGDHYELNSFVLSWLTKGLQCQCMLRLGTDGEVLFDKTGWVIPVDLIVGSLIFLGIFGYLQFIKSNIKSQKSK